MASVLAGAWRYKGKPLSPLTVTRAHRVLRAGLARAVRLEIVARNVAGVVSPPQVDQQEVEILTPDQVGEVLEKLRAGLHAAGLRGVPGEPHALYAVAVLAIATGMRRGELLALAWSHVDLDAGEVHVMRSLEQTAAGLRFKPPKNDRTRTLRLPQSAVSALQEHRLRQLELRMKLGLGKPERNALVFCRYDGEPIPPDDLSRDWRRTCALLKLPVVTFHSLRHMHGSAPIAGGMDVVKVSKRLGHANPTTTLRVYSHLLNPDDSEAAAMIEHTLRTAGERKGAP
jgi:integrase